MAAALAACSASDRTQLRQDQPLEEQPLEQPASFGARDPAPEAAAEPVPQPLPATPRTREAADALLSERSPLPVSSADAVPSSAPDECAPGTAYRVHLTWSELQRDPDCSFLSTPLVAGEPASGLAFNLGSEGLAHVRAGLLELQLGAAVFRWQQGASVEQGAFRRELQCAASPLSFSGSGAWRFVEAFHGAWLEGAPGAACSAEPLRFAGSYHYDECELQFDRSCLRGAATGNCSAFGVLEMRFEPAEREPEAAPPVSSPSCGPVPEPCGGQPCRRRGAPCTVNDECEAGLFCAAPACDGAGACGPLPSFEECSSAPLEGACGCDGVSHLSLCFAHFVASRATPGDCGSGAL